MSWSIAQSPVNIQNASGSVTTVAATFGGSVTPGNLIVAAISNYGGGTVIVRDSVNTTNYTQRVISEIVVQQSAIFTFLVPPGGGGSGFTVTMTATNASAPGITIYEFGFTPGDVLLFETPTGTGTGTGATPSTGPLTITGNDLVFAATAFGATETVTAGSGFTLGPIGAFSAFNAEGLATEYILNQTGTPVTPTFSLGGSTSYSACAVAVKAGPPPITLVPYANKEGLLILGVENPGATLPVSITAIGSSPTWHVNGSPISTYGPVWSDTSKVQPFATWQNTSGIPILSTDVVTYTIASGAITTALGVNGVVSSPAPVANYVGQLEPGFGGIPSFVPRRTMPMGVNMGGPAYYNYAAQFQCKNLMKRVVFSPGAGNTITYDVNDPTLPSFFTPGGGMNAIVVNSTGTNGIEVGSGQVGYPSPEGIYTITFVDINALNAGALKVFLVGNPLTCFGSDTTGTGLHNGNRTVAVDNQTVTITYDLHHGTSAGANPVNTANGYNFGMTIYLGSTSGNFANLSTITKFWFFLPGETIDTSDPLAMADWMRLALTAPNGNGPAMIRGLENISPAGYGNFRTRADLQKTSYFSYGLQPVVPVAVVSVRPYNTNPALDNVTGDSTYGWAASTKIYEVDDILPVDGTDGTGSYLDLTARPSLGGETDMGQYLNPSAGNPVSAWAALEFVCSSPHPFRTGDQLAFPLATVATPCVFPITGGATTALTGTVNVTHGSQAITFSNSQTFSGGPNGATVNTGVVFGGDASLQGYFIALTVTTTGTVFTIFPAYHGTTATTTCNLSAVVDIGNLQQTVSKTGQYTFALACGFSYGTVSGSAIQQLTVTAQIPCAISVAALEPGGCAPYGQYARFAKYWPGCKLFVPLMPHSNVDCCNAIADDIADNSLPGQIVYFEVGDEHWNTPGFKTGLATTMFGRLIAFYGANTQINSMYNTGVTPAALNNDQAYVAILADKVATIRARWIATGANLTAVTAIGGQWSNSSVMSRMITFASNNQIPVGAGTVAPYYGTPSDTTWQHACNTGGTNPGSWPADLMNSYMRHVYRYSSGAFYSSNYAALQLYSGPIAPGQTNGKPTMFGYEGQIQSINPVVGSTGYGPDHDCFYHPTMADTWNSFIQSAQDGDLTVPGSGLAWINLYTFGCQWGNSAAPQALWSVFIYQGQVAGSGVGNLMSAPQSGGDGFCHDVQNQSIELAQMNAWFGAANGTPTPTPTPTPTTGGNLLSVSGVPTAVNVAGTIYAVKAN